MTHEHEHAAFAHKTERPSFARDSTAASLGIPVEHRQHPTVGEFIGLVNRVENLQSDCARALSESGSIDDADARGIAPSLADRYETAELMLRVVHAVLTDRLNGGVPVAENPGYITSKLNAALSRYGLEVANHQLAQAPEPTDPL